MDRVLIRIESLFKSSLYVDRVLNICGESAYVDRVLMWIENEYNSTYTDRLLAGRGQIQTDCWLAAVRYRLLASHGQILTIG